MRSKIAKNTSVRGKIGLSQEEYILYLCGVNRSTLAMYENGKRSLPFEASVRNAAIEIALSKPETERSIETMALQQKRVSVAALTKRRDYCLFLIKKTLLQLAKMQKRYRQCLNMIAVSATAPAILTELFPNNSRHAKDRGCLEIFGVAAKNKLEHCSTSQQQLLQLKMEALQFEADKIQRLLNDNASVVG
jgi:transcriptional regulator with XRE-family HTH domain